MLREMEGGVEEVWTSIEPRGARESDTMNFCIRLVCASDVRVLETNKQVFSFFYYLFVGS